MAVSRLHIQALLKNISAYDRINPLQKKVLILNIFSFTLRVMMQKTWENSFGDLPLKN